jgi:hypothetical protein
MSDQDYWLYGIPGDDGPAHIDGPIPRIGEIIKFSLDADKISNHTEKTVWLEIQGVHNVLDTKSANGYRSVVQVFAIAFI